MAIVDLGIVPIIVQPPLSQSVVAGGSVTFSVEVTGNPLPFDYEWRRTTNPRFTNRVVLNERRSFFTLDNVQTNHAWSKLADVIARATNRTETAIDAGAGTNRYYRVVTPRQP